MPKAGTRPTSDRVREAIFSTLGAWNLDRDTRVLDLYAGSGALGLEAASRGSHHITLVERNPQAAQVASANATIVCAAFRSTKPPTVKVSKQAVQPFLDSHPANPLWDVVFIDPPYDVGETEITANLTSLVPLITADAVVMVERSSRSPQPTWPSGMSLLKEKRYGETVLWWAELTVAEPNSDATSEADAGLTPA